MQLDHINKLLSRLKTQRDSFYEAALLASKPALVVENRTRFEIAIEEDKQCSINTALRKFTTSDVNVFDNQQKSI